MKLSNLETTNKTVQNNAKLNTVLKSLYENPMPSTRTGPIYNAFSYPTKISPEAIAIFIAIHTKPGETVLDTFAGSGTTGLAALLCDKPTPLMKQIAYELGVKPKWGPRKAILYELGVMGAFVSRTMCLSPDPNEFKKAAEELTRNFFFCTGNAVNRPSGPVKAARTFLSKDPRSMPSASSGRRSVRRSRWAMPESASSCSE